MLNERWYLLGPRWCIGKDAGLEVLAGSPDPAKGVFVASAVPALHYNDTPDSDAQHVREALAHIVDLHNAWLETQ